MTSVVYEEKFIRSSVDDLFSIEKSGRWNFGRPFYQPTLYGTEEIVNERKSWVEAPEIEDEEVLDIFFSNVEKIEYAEFINWDEIFVRENELRPDLKSVFDLIKHLYPTENPLRTRTGPPYNPFSLTMTGIFTFKTFEAFDTVYNKCNIENTNMAIWSRDEIINNQYVERLLIDNVEYDYPFLSNRIRSTYGE